MRWWLICVTILLVAFGWTNSAHAQGVQKAPVLLSPVTDLTGTLSSAEQQQLRSKLVAFEKNKGTQIAVLIVDSTKPEDVFSYANRIANTYKLGRKNVGDGILVVVAKSDRRMSIQVAKTLEGAVPDVLAGRVISEQITPKFKQGQYFAGVNAGVDALIGLVNEEPLPTPQQTAGGASNGQTGDRVDLFSLLFFGIIFLPAAAGVARSLLGRVPAAVVVGGVVGGLTAWALPSLGVFVGLSVGICAFIWILAGGGNGGGWTSSGSSGNSGGWSSGSSSDWSSGSSSDWGGGGWSSGGSDWSSGGGGDFGGGGASGDW